MMPASSMTGCLVRPARCRVAVTGLSVAEGVLGLRAAARVPATLREIGEAVRLARYTVACHLSITEEDGRLPCGEDRGTGGASAEIGPAKPHRLMAIF